MVDMGSQNELQYSEKIKNIKVEKAKKTSKDFFNHFINKFKISKDVAGKR